MNFWVSENLRTTFAVLFLVVGGTVPAWGASGDVELKDLSEDGKRVVEYLKEDWKKRFRSTSIPWAMKNLSVDPDDDLRLQVGQYFRDNPRVSRNLRFWGANNYILSDLEKRIAKYVINAYQNEDGFPRLRETAHALGMDKPNLKRRLEFMSRAGLLERSEDTDLGYSLTNRYNRWGGPLRHNYHTVHVEGEKPFGVW